MTLEKHTKSYEQGGCAWSPPAPYDLRVDGRPSREEQSRAVNPAWRTHPRLSWRTNAVDRDAFEVAVFDEDHLLVWSSGKGTSTQTFAVLEAELAAHAVIHWSVRVRRGDAWSVCRQVLGCGRSSGSRVPSAARAAMTAALKDLPGPNALPGEPRPGALLE